MGDQVAVDPSLYCFECYYCQLGKNNLCENWNAIGVTKSGAAAEFVAAPHGNCVVLPDGVRVEDYALVEPLSCAVRGYDVLTSQLGAHVLIYGAGTMGLMMLQLAKAVGAVTRRRGRRQPRPAEGRAASSAAPRPPSSADEIERPRLWDLVIDATGNDKAIQDGLGRVGKGGTFLQFGVVVVRRAGHHRAVQDLQPGDHHHRLDGRAAQLRAGGRAVRDGVIDPDVFISHRLPLDDYAGRDRGVQAGAGLKTQVLPNT